jgi:hypothetical protein
VSSRDITGLLLRFAELRLTPVRISSFEIRCRNLLCVRRVTEEPSFIPYECYTQCPRDRETKATIVLHEFSLSFRDYKAIFVNGHKNFHIWVHIWSDNKVCELIVVKVLHTSLLNITVVAFNVLLVGSYAPMPAPSPPFKTILELVLWNGLQSCCYITPDVISVINMPPFQYFLYLPEKSLGARSSEQGGCSSTVICLLAKNSLTDSAVSRYIVCDTRR